jgi:hypothetical protein
MNDDLLRALAGVGITAIVMLGLWLVGRVVGFTLAGSLRSSAAGLMERQINLWERQIKSSEAQTELRRRQIEVLERIAVALEAKKDHSPWGREA